METPEGWGICVKEAEELEVPVILVAGNPGDERNVLSSFGLGVVLRYRQEDDVHEVQLWGLLSRNNRAFLRREKMKQEVSTDRVPISANESTGIGSFSENETAEENELLNRLLHKEVSTGLTPTSTALVGVRPVDEPTGHPHTRAMVATAVGGCFYFCTYQASTSYFSFSLVACLPWKNLIELSNLKVLKQKVKKFQQNSFEEAARSGKLQSKVLQLSEMLEELVYCTYFRQAAEQRLLAGLAECQQSCSTLCSLKTRSRRQDAA